MKIIKATLQKHRTSTETNFKYPNGWDASKINVVVYEDTGNQGNVEEYCIGLVHDDEYAQQLFKDEKVLEIDEIEANLLGDKCKPQRLTVDEDKLPEILIALANVPNRRSKAERDMLNPDHDAKGIRKTVKFNVRNWFPE